jgi:hypothetical protein
MSLPENDSDPPSRSPMRTPTLSARLLLVTSAALLPLAVVCGFALHGLLDGQRAQTQASTLGVARALATAVDGELRLTVAALQALALTEPLGEPETSGLVDALLLAKALRASHPEWRGVLLATPEGKVIFSTEGAVASPADDVVESASLAQVVRTGQPAVGPLMPGRKGNLAFAVRVPVLRNDAVRYVLTAIVRPEAIARGAGAPARARGLVGVDLRRQRPARGALARGREVSRPGAQRLAEGAARFAPRPQGVRGHHAQRRRHARADRGVAARLRAVDGGPRRAHRGGRGRAAPHAHRLWQRPAGLAARGRAGRLVDVARHHAAHDAAAPERRRARPRPAGDQRASGIAEVDAVGHALSAAAGQRLQHEVERECLLAPSAMRAQRPRARSCGWSGW